MLVVHDSQEPHKVGLHTHLGQAGVHRHHQVGYRIVKLELLYKVEGGIHLVQGDTLEQLVGNLPRLLVGTHLGQLAVVHWEGFQAKNKN